MTVRLSVRPPPTCQIYYHYTDAVKELERKIQRQKKRKKGDEVHWKKKHEKFKATVRKREMLVASKVEMSGSEKKRLERRNICDFSSTKRATR